MFRQALLINSNQRIGPENKFTGSYKWYTQFASSLIVQVNKTTSGTKIMNRSYKLPEFTEDDEERLTAKKEEIAQHKEDHAHGGTSASQRLLEQLNKDLDNLRDDKKEARREQDNSNRAAANIMEWIEASTTADAANTVTIVKNANVPMHTKPLLIQNAIRTNHFLQGSAVNTREAVSIEIDGLPQITTITQMKDHVQSVTTACILILGLQKNVRPRYGSPHHQ